MIGLRSSRRRVIAFVVVGAMSLLLFGLLHYFGDEKRRGSDLADNTALVRGAEIYAEACASCHGGEFEGQPNWREPGPDGRLPAPPHDETGHTWHHSDRKLFQITKFGTAAVIGGGYESNMPGFGDAYSDEEIDAVLAWIKSRWPARERNYQAEVTAREEAAQ